MRRTITTVLIAVTVSPFAYLATTDAVSISQHLQEQNSHIEQLNTEYVELDTQLNEIIEIKEKAAQEVEQLELEAQNAIDERKKLEAELVAM